MSKYTTELRFICESLAGLNESVEYPSIQAVLDKSRDKVFDFNFPIFDENYRPVLEDKILRHFYTREIGGETVGLWKLWLETRMNEIMPYYNQLYQSELIKFNPMYDVDLTRTHTKEDDRKDNVSESELRVSDTDTTVSTHEEGNNETKTHSETDSWEMFSDTPSGALDGLKDDKYISNATHKTDEADNKVNGTNSADSNGNSSTDFSEDTTRNKQATIKNIQDYQEHVMGKTAGVSFSKMLLEFRETFLNIDMMVINELDDLFFTLW